MRQSQIIPSLNAGELSPYIQARTDYAQRPKGLRLCENFIPLIQGPLSKRPGTRYASEVKDSSKSVRLVDFVFADDDAFILEFGDQYIRFYTDRAQVLDGGAAYEIASPYDEADLPLMRFSQSADVIYIAHPLYVPRKLSRFGATNWTLETIDFENGPIGDENTDDAHWISASAVTGAVTLTSNNDVFTSDHVGAVIQLRQEDNGGIAPFEAGAAYSSNAFCSYNGNFYFSSGGGTAGGDPPIHTEGSAKDGPGGVTWQYIHDGAGVVKITAVTDAQNATGTVQSRLPDDVANNDTAYWAFGDWTAANGYPGAVCFYGDRLYWAGSPTFPQRIWGSVVGDYENHKSGTEDDSALSLTISASQVNTIRWMVNDERGLLIGTTRGEWVVRPSNQNEALTPFNGQATQMSNYGSNFVDPPRVGRAIMFIQAASRKLREMAYSLEVDSFAAPDMTVRAEHITQSGLISSGYQAQPNPTLWTVRADGVMPGFTYERDQEVLAWHRHILGGYSDAAQTENAIVEDVASIPAPDGSRDDLWLVVKRYINGGVKRYIEYLSEEFGHETETADAVFLDCSFVYSGAAATAISGLDPLEGQTVGVLADGAVHPDVVVSGGAITLEFAAEKVQVGLKYRALFKTETLDTGAAPGNTAQGSVQRIIKVLFRLYRSGGFMFGPDENTMEPMSTRSTDDLMDMAPPLLDGDYPQEWPGTWARKNEITVVSEAPLPLTVLGLVPTVEVTSP